MIKSIGRPIRPILNLIRALPYSTTRWNPKKDKLIIVTGADSSHFKSLRQFLSGVMKHESGTHVIAYDLGLTELQGAEIQKTYPSVELRLFDFSLYPAFFNIKIHTGEYAWKPVIICDVLQEFKCYVCWMDAGNVITASLTWIRKFVKKTGLYSPYSAGRVSDWTHPGTLKFLGASKDLLKKRNLSGACVAVSYRHEKARKLVNKWKECALIRDCIAPAGSSRENHRQDQSVLSVLAHQSGIVKVMPSAMYGFKTHQDIRDRL